MSHVPGGMSVLPTQSHITTQTLDSIKLYWTLQPLWQLKGGCYVSLESIH